MSRHARSLSASAISWLLAVGLVLLTAAGPAVATVGPPLSVKLLAGPGPARAGETYKGTLAIVADEPVELSGFRLEGKAWEQLSLEAPATTAAARNARLEVSFSAVPRDADEPLVIAFEVDGRTVRHELDLSERHYRRMKEGAPAQPLPTGARRFVPPSVWRDSGVQPPATPPADVGIRPAPTGAQTYNIKVTGGWYYLHPLAGWIGTQDMAIQVWEYSSFIPEIVATTATQENGRFTATFAWDPADGYPTISVKFVTSGARISVHDHTYDDNYVWHTANYSNFTGTSLDVGDLTAADEALMPAMHIQSMMTRNWEWHNSFGYPPSYETVFFPGGPPGNYHNSEGVHIDNPWHEGGYAHEYGHHWQTDYAPVPSYSYYNLVCDGDPPTPPGGHCYWCWENAPVPTMEGFCYWLGDVVPRAIELDTGIPLNDADNAEPLFLCPEDATYHDPYSTEGFYGALLRDIYDATPDTHNVYGSWHDSLTESAHEILGVVHNDNPTTPLNFLTALMVRYPAVNKANLWETAINCGYNLDTTGPGVVTGLTSTSHTVNVSSADQTIAFSWTHAADDISGIEGYGITVAHSYGLPSAVQDLGKVTTYTTSALAPGTWYFSIRARDRFGNWSGSYVHAGPYIIRDPQPSDLQPHISFGWTRPLVPREDNAATGTNVPEPVTLTGNVADTYWNLNGLNDGESATGAFSARIYVDEVYVDVRSWTNINGGGNYMVTNDGPLTIRGGRHTFEVIHDALEQVAETDETDNAWAHQWVWTPQQLTLNSLTTRSAPPLYQAGWDAVVDGSILYYNCDGLSFSGVNYVGGGQSWDAVYLYAIDNADDYDCRMHTHTTGAGNGFTSTNQGWSGRPAGYLDAVIVNSNTAGINTRDVGVLNEGAKTGSYRAMRLRAGSLALDDSVTVALAQNAMMIMRTFTAATADTGWYTITVSVDPPTQRFQVQAYLPTFTTGTIGSYDARASATTGSAKMNRHVTQTGVHGMIVYRNPMDGTDACTFTLEMERTPPDFTPYVSGGWAAPFVPRPLPDGTPTLVARPDTLHGNSSATYFNYSWKNDSPAAWNWDGVHSANAIAVIDGAGNLGGVGVSSFGPWQVKALNQTSTRTVSGGRHVAAMVLDINGDITELDEDDNVYGEQYCWSPYPLAFGAPITRTAPPDKTGGWSQILSGETRWYNCDGLRVPAGGVESWRAIAVMPGAGADVDVRLHFALLGAKSGFASNVAGSAWGLGQSDFGLICAHDFFVLPAMTGPVDAGVILGSGTSGYLAEAVLGTPLTPGGNQTYGPYTVGAQRVMHLYSVWLTPDTWTLRLDNVAGTVDWGLSLYAPDGPFKGKSGAMADGLVYLNGGGQSESLTVDIATDGWYALAVWKVGAGDLAGAGTYELRVFPGVSGVPGSPPPAAVLNLAAAQPNPFNPLTRIVYDVPTAGLVRLEVYDLRGACVRTLVTSEQTAGRHETRWDGRNDRGQWAASGSYVIRLVTEQGVRTRKVTLAK